MLKFFNYVLKFLASKEALVRATEIKTCRATKIMRIRTTFVKRLNDTVQYISKRKNDFDLLTASDDRQVKLKGRENLTYRHPYW